MNSQAYIIREIIHITLSMHTCLHKKSISPWLELAGMFCFEILRKLNLLLLEGKAKRIFFSEEMEW